MFQHIANDELQEFFCELHVVFELVKGHLRLDHPEFGQMARRVAVLRAEGRAEGINFRKCQGENLSFQLTAYGEIGRPAEKILLPVDVAVGGARQIRKLKEVTLNIWPAPSQSEVVMIGVWT